MSPTITGGRKRLGRWLILAAIVASVVPFFSLLSWPTNWLAKITATSETGTEEQTAFQVPCSQRYTSASKKRIAVQMPANGDWSEKVTLSGEVGKCRWFEGPPATEVRFDDGTCGPITKDYGTKIPIVQFRNPGGGQLQIAIEL